MRRIYTKICNFIFGKHESHTFPRVWILVADMAIVIFAYIVASLLLSFDYLPNVTINWKQSWLIPVVYLATFLISRTYDGMLRYSGFNDIRKIFTSCTFTLLALLISKVFFIKFYNSFAVDYYPRMILILYHYLITLVLMIVMRFTIRWLYNEVYKHNPNKINTIVYGAGDGGTMLMRTLSQDPSSRFRIMAFVDDDPKRIKSEINTIKVYSPQTAMTTEFVEKYDIDVMIVAIPSLSEQRKKEIIEQGMALNLNVKSIPSFDKWVDGKLSTSQIEDIRIEDVLGRRPIILGKANVKNEVNGKVVLVTGAAGSIGNEICRQLMYYSPSRLIMLDQAESALFDFQFEMNNNDKFAENRDKMTFVVSDVKDPLRMREIFELYHPSIVYHAAAYKHVPFMEENAYEAVLVNVFGTKNMADLAVEFGVEKFVMFSTDKAVNPTSVMGASKRIAEIYTQSRQSATKFITTRFGNVLDSNGSVVPLFRKQIAQGGPITVTDKRITRFFMTISEACSLVLEAGSIGEGGDIFVFDMGEKVRIWDLAEKMRKLSHHPEIEIIEIGLRPGEKLYEELLANEENSIKTGHDKILRAVVRNYKSAEVDLMMEQLRTELETCDAMKIVAMMKSIVPEYKSNNSIFSALDN